VPRPRRRLGQIDLFTRRVRAVDHQRSATEFQLACSVADVLRRWIARGWRWNHMPLGEERPTTAGERLKRMGLQAGWPDLILLSPSPASLAHFLELKRLKRGRLSDEQQDFAKWCLTHGYPYETANSIKAALAVLRGWGALRVNVEVAA
jgi:hypothetical protein